MLGTTAIFPLRAAANVRSRHRHRPPRSSTYTAVLSGLHSGVCTVQAQSSEEPRSAAGTELTSKQGSVYLQRLRPELWATWNQKPQQGGFSMISL